MPRRAYKGKGFLLLALHDELRRADGIISGLHHDCAEAQLPRQIQQKPREIDVIFNDQKTAGPLGQGVAVIADTLDHPNGAIK